MSSNGHVPPVKLKINTSQANNTFSSAAATPTPSTGLKLSFKPQVTPTASLPAPPKPKRQYVRKADKVAASKGPSKKRTRDDEDELAAPSPSAKKQAKAANVRRLALPAGSPSTIIKLKPASALHTHSPLTPRLKIKHKGKPPVRPLGVGYDSEASEAETDPAIEENFILRMVPGADCDYVRDAITNGKIGAKLSESGAQINFKFFSRDGRRACVTVQGRHYAAILVDLPCIVESMKSWDKRGWWKAGDICQMLVVMPGVLAKEDDAKTVPIPREWRVDEKNWQWPHGLTPPMRDCRAKRFRKRISHTKIEEAEAEVERLLAADEKASKTEYVVVDENEQEQDESEQEQDEDEMEYEEEDAEGEADVQDEQDQEEEEDAEALAARMEQELVGDDDEDDTATSAAAPGDTSASTPAEMATATTPAAEESTSAAVTEAEDDDAEDDDDAESDEDADEDDREQAQFEQQQREEIGHLERELASANEQLAKLSNPLLRQRTLAKIKSLGKDLQVKKQGLGEGGDEDA